MLKPCFVLVCITKGGPVLFIMNRVAIEFFYVKPKFFGQKKAKPSDL